MTEAFRSAQIQFVSIAQLRLAPGNARVHSKAQLRQIAGSIQRFGFTNPVLVSDGDEIIAGHDRVQAAKDLGISEIPTIRLTHLTAAERRAYVLADNKLALNAGWDRDLLAIELQGLIDLDFDLTVTGFSLAEIDFTLDAAREKAPEERAAEDEVPDLPLRIVSRRGDMWQLEGHRLLCGDAQVAGDVAAVQACCPDRRCDPRLLKARRIHPRCLLWVGLDADRGGDLRPPGPADRDRSGLLRHHRAALAASDGVARCSDADRE